MSNSKDILTNSFSSSAHEVTGNLLKRTKGDKVIWAIVVVLTMVSILVVYSSIGSLAYKMNKSTESYLFKQIGFIALGVLIIYFAHRVNYTIYSRVATILFLISVPLLIYTLKFGSSINEANRWIKLPVINMTFQTSDLAKLALFMYISRQLSRRQNVIKDFKKGFLPLIVPVIIICILIAPANLSTALLIGGTAMMLMFIGRVSLRHIMLVVASALVPLMLLILVATHYYNKEDHTSKDLPSILTFGRMSTWIKRVQDFMYSDKSDASYQVQQAKIAIAKGGLLGKGPGKSEQRNFLPHPYSDFIYAIIIEEYGLAGGTIIVLIYLLFLFRSIRIFQRCPYAFGAFLAVALSFTLVIQAMVNMGVTVNLFPTTGVTLPLVSMGGSSLWFTCFAIGIILSVARNVEQMEGKEPEPELEPVES
ncbi:cell division protein FtsW [Ginsengibacter hankyongi]|uniref:Probable peptidoglycan glycosyltransferase FtsW n=1 Tax=Ginsengibacter hankyongi TaxID=2607284 RepID=A0A5J5ILK9_9BACT|nr:FtsW/RodA/SpoVE family cell cycle protein [Ginsengibacter hankyongi]KAA9041428.1 cell division protein FtsW [Ginsengibacter hankyongi]